LIDLLCAVGKIFLGDSTSGVFYITVASKNASGRILGFTESFVELKMFV
jgi:hypothetical protein